MEAPTFTGVLEITEGTTVEEAAGKLDLDGHFELNGPLCRKRNKSVSVPYNGPHYGGPQFEGVPGYPSGSLSKPDAHQYRR